MTFQEAIVETRERIINRTLITTTIFVIIALISSIMRVVLIGWQPAIYLHIVSFFIVLSVCINRKRIPLKIKTHILLLIFLTIAITGVINFRIAGGSFLIFAVITIAILIYGFKIGIIYSIVFMGCMVIAAILHMKNFFDFKIDFNIYTNNKISWISYISGYTFSLAVMIDSLVLYYNFLMGYMKESFQKSADLMVANANLQKTEKRYRSLFEGSKDGIVLVDKNLIITDCNKSYLDLVGYELSELVGKNYKYGLPVNNIDWDEYFMKLAKEKNKVAECLTRHKDNRYIPIEISPNYIEDDEEVNMWGVIRDLSEKKKLENEVFTSMITAEERERERYAKELHDGLGPLLSTGLIYINAISEEPDEKTIKEYSQRAYDIIKEATSVVKEISNNLSPVILTEYGITHAIRSFIEKTQYASNIKFRIVDNNQNRYAPIIEFTMYRTLVELINNSIKYSKANNVTLTFQNVDQVFEIFYEDDGLGFDYDDALKNKHGFGLLNMENRIKKINGLYLYNTAPSKGVKVSIKIKVS